MRRRVNSEKENLPCPLFSQEGNSESEETYSEKNCTFLVGSVSLFEKGGTQGDLIFSQLRDTVRSWATILL
jgi:hypothetical protein